MKTLLTIVFAMIIGIFQSVSQNDMYDLTSKTTVEPESSIPDSLIVFEELAPKVFFYDLDFEWTEFRKLAKDIDKPFFVDFYASWCAPCKLMDELVYSDPNIALYVNDEFMAYKVNAEFFEGMDLVEKYRIKEYPTVLFFSPEGKIIGRESGLYNAEGFMVLLKKYLSNI